MWCSLEDFVYAVTDGDHLPPPQSNSGIPFLVISDVNTGVINFDKARFVPDSYYDSLPTIRKASIHDILFTVTGSYGIVIPVETEERFCFQRHIGLIKTIESHEWLVFVLQSRYVQAYCDKVATGTAQKTVSLGALRDLPIPIPPREEQERIGERLQEWLTISNHLGVAGAELNRNIVLAKTKILDLAIHGKLVPQDPSDEPAIELLKRINPAFQPSDNLHYEGVLPNGWTMARIESFCTTINGLWKGDKEPLINVGVIRNANFTKDFLLDYSKIEHINVEERSFVKRNLEDGDIIVEKSGGSDNFPVGRSILYRGESGKYSFSNFTMSLRIKDKSQIIPEYLYYALQNMYRRGDMRQMQTQTTGLHNLLTDVFTSAQIPIPPSSEQWRIVEAIENHFQTLDRIRDLLQN